MTNEVILLFGGNRNNYINSTESVCENHFVWKPITVPF